MLIHEDRLFPAEPTARGIARALYASIKDLPIVSPHGHTQAAWFARNEPFPDPAKLFVQPDHYVYRMLYSQGVSMDDLEIGQSELKDPRKVWRIFANHYYLFRGTPTRIWLDFAFHQLFGLNMRLSEATADLYFDTISEKLRTAEFLPRALFERFNLEVLATTDSPIDSLADHQAIRDSPRFCCRSRIRRLYCKRRHARPADWTRRLHMERIPQCTPQSPCALPFSRLHRDGSRPSNSADRRPFPA